MLSRWNVFRHLCGGLSCVALLTAVPEPADAYLRDFVAHPGPLVAESADPPTSPIPHAASAFHCPPGRDVLLGVGGATDGHLGLGLTRLWINKPRTGGALVGAEEIDPVSSAWRLGGVAYCAAFTRSSPWEVPGSGQYVADVDVVSKFSLFDSKPARTIRAACPGRRAIAGGFNLHGRNVTVTSARLNQGDGSAVLDEFEVHALRSLDDTGAEATSPWRLTVYAVCARFARFFGARSYVGDSIITIEATSPWNTNSSPPSSSFVDKKSVTARCPAGHRVIGGSGGAFLDTDTGSPPRRGVALSGSAPSREGWTATAYEEDGTGLSWEVSARAVCATFTAGQVVADRIRVG